VILKREENKMKKIKNYCQKCGRMLPDAYDRIYRLSSGQTLHAGIKICECKNKKEARLNLLKASHKYEAKNPIKKCHSPKKLKA
jgi:hypothetical protein